jgi:hypothetical protein
MVWAWATATHSRRTRAAHRDDNCCKVMVKYEFSIQARSRSQQVVHPENGRQAKHSGKASLPMSQLVVTLSAAQLSSYLQCRKRKQAMGAWNSIQRSCNRSSTKTQAPNGGRGLVWLFLRGFDCKMRCGHGGRVRMQDADVTATAACTACEWTRGGMRSTGGQGSWGSSRSSASAITGFAGVIGGPHCAGSAEGRR